MSMDAAMFIWLTLFGALLALLLIGSMAAEWWGYWTEKGRMIARRKSWGSHRKT